MTLQIVLAVWLIVSTMAMHTGLSPWLGTWKAWPLTLAFAAASVLATAAWRRRQPRFIELDTQGANTLTIFAQDGTRVADGRLAGCAQWGGWLLVLAVETAGRRRTLLVAADTVTRAAFRELAVRGRIAGRRPS